MAEERWTIRRLLEWTEGFFRDKGNESPRLEAQILLAHVLGCKRIDLYTRTEEEPTADRRSAFKSLIKERVDGSPVAYLVGQREFYSLSFQVSPAVLIPRPETELLVMECLNLIQGKERPRVLDIGTGSGNIAVSIAHQNKAAHVTAIEISSEALAVARGNAERHGVAERIQFLEGDLFAPLAEQDRFDVIVSNPPYVSAGDFENLAPAVRDREPRQALLAGADGMDVYRRLIPAASQHLEPGAALILEIGSTQEAPVRALIESTPDLRFVKCIRDPSPSRLPRIVHAVRDPIKSASSPF